MINKERIFFAACALFAAFCAVRMALGAVETLPDAPERNLEPPKRIWRSEDIAFPDFSWEITDETLALLVPNPKGGRSLFRAVSEATSLPPVDLEVPAAELTLRLRYPTVPAFRVDTLKYRPGSAEHTPLLNPARAAKRYIWLATVSFQGGPPEEVQVFSFDQNPEQVTLKRGAMAPVTYNLETDNLKLVKLGPSPAEAYYRLVGAERKDDPDAQLRLARWCITNMDPDEPFLGTLEDKAAGHLRAALRAAPKQSLPYLYLAELSVSRGDTDAAMEALLNARKAGAADARIPLRLGLLMCRLTLWESAREQFQLAAADKELAGSALCYVGETFLKTGEYDQAERRFNQAAARPGATLLARAGLGLAALLKKADRPGGGPVLDPRDTDPLSIAARNGQPEAQINRVAALLLDGRAGAAANEARALLKARPTRSDARLAANWVLALGADQRLGEAEAELKRLAPARPVMGLPISGFAHDRLLQSYLDLLHDTPERVNTATDLLLAVRRARAGAPADAGYLPRVYALLAFSRYQSALLAGNDAARSKLYAEAENLFVKAMAYGYDMEASLAGAARCALANARDRAQTYLARAVEINPANVAPRKKLVELYLRSRSNDKARTLARRLVEDRPRDPFAVACLAIVEYRNRNTRTAVRLLDELATATGAAVPVFITRLQVAIDTHQARSRYRFTFSKPDSDDVGWEWAEQEDREAGIVIQVEDEAVHLRVAHAQRELEPAISKTVVGETLRAVSASLQAAEAADGALGIAIRVAAPRAPRGGPFDKPAAPNEVALYKTARDDRSVERVAFKLTRTDGTTEERVLIPWLGKGFHTLKIEVTDKSSFVFYLDGEEIGASKTRLDLSGGMGRGKRELLVRVFGRVRTGHTWHAVADDIEILQQRLDRDG